jgi:TRAP-type C4-dicarboxylate transport system substrate-binding protein
MKVFMALMRYFSLLLVIGPVFMSGACPVSAQESKDAKGQLLLRLSYPVPSTSIDGVAYEFFAKTVEQESNGRMKIRTYPAASLVSDVEILDTVIKGNVDIGHFMIAFITPTIKELTPFEIPGAYFGGRNTKDREAIESIVDKVFAKYGVKYLSALPVGTVSFAASKKVNKLIRMPADLKGLKVRSPGKWGGEAIKIWGGSPVTIALGDMTIALSLGTVGAIYSSWNVLGPLKVYEPAPYITITDMEGGILGGLMMNLKVWDKLTKEQQGVLVSAAAKWHAKRIELGAEFRKKLEADVKKVGGEVHYSTKEEVAAFEKATRPLFDEAKTISGPEGSALIQIFEKGQK